MYVSLSSRAMLNHLDVLRYLMSKEKSNSKQISYSSKRLQICSTMLALPEITVAQDVYKVVCKQYVNLAMGSKNLDTIIKATTECLDKRQYMDVFSQHFFR